MNFCFVHQQPAHANSDILTDHVLGIQKGQASAIASFILRLQPWGTATGGSVF